LADFTAHIANLLMIGNKFEIDGTSYIELKLGERQIKIIQNPNIATIYKNLSSCHGRLVSTTKVIVTDVETDEIEDVRNMIFSLCCLLSFITCSQVVFHSQEYPKSSSSWAIVGKTSIYHNVLDIGNGEVVADFIQTVWDRFISIEKDRRLDMIFDYIHHALYPGSTVESKLVFTFVTLESLKYTFALSKGYPFIDGFFRKLNQKKNNLPTPINWLLKRIFKESKVGFNKLLLQMFKEEKITITKAEMKKIISLRNEIIHSGISQSNFNFNFKVFIETQNLIREYLIKLLGYSDFYKRV